MIPTIHIELASKTDIPELCQLLNQAYRENGGWTNEHHLVVGDRATPELLTKVMRQPNTGILKLVENTGENNAKTKRLFACVQIERVGADAIIGGLAVQPNLQSRGYGRQLLRQAEIWASQNFGAKIIQWVLYVLEGRNDLISFYLSCGYIVIDDVFPFPNETDVGSSVDPQQKIIKLVKNIP